MTHTVAYNIELGIIETRAEGNLTFDGHVNFSDL